MGQQVEFGSPYYSFDLKSSLERLFYCFDNKFYTDFHYTIGIKEQK